VLQSSAVSQQDYRAIQSSGPTAFGLVNRCGFFGEKMENVFKSNQRRKTNAFVWILDGIQVYKYKTDSWEVS